MVAAGSAKEFILARIREEDRGYTSPCWLWQLGLTPTGYAKTFIAGFGKNTRVHRASYAIFVGPIPDGLTIDHLCRVKHCCNPAHLEPVTDEENRRRAIANGLVVGRFVRQTHCKHGHELVGENVRTSKNGNRFCVICHRARHRKYMREWSRKRRTALRPFHPKGADHCVRGHAYTPDNTVIDKAGNRRCGTCRNWRTA
jgi:hypothetical protein